MSDSDNWEDLLITTIRAGDVEEVRRALDSGEKLDTYSQYGETPLGVAAYMGHLEIMCLLLKRGADPDEKDYEGYTAIKSALMHNQFDAIDLLLDCGTPEAQVRRAVDTLLLAAGHCNLSLLYRLIDRGVDINSAKTDGWTALMSAIQVGSNRKLKEEDKARRRQTIHLLLERGADAHPRGDVHRDRAAFTPMILAAEGGDRETVDLLRQMGAEITLTEAAALGDEETVRRLLQQGIDPDWRDAKGETALVHAARKGHVSIARLLLEKGADPYGAGRQESWDLTPFEAASEEGQTEVLSVLLETTLGIRMDMQFAEIGRRLDGAAGRAKLLTLIFGSEGEQTEKENYQGQTPLMEAAYNNNVSLVNLLLGAGCDVNVGNVMGYTALMVACECGMLATVRLLLEAGADPNRRNAQGNPALICAIVPGADKDLHEDEEVRAVREDMREIVRLLIAAGAGVNAQNDYCRAPLDYAIELQRHEIAEVLRAAGAITTEESA